MSGRNLRLAIGTGTAGLALLAGGLLFGGTLVSAQEPTPSASEEAAPSTPEAAPSTPQDRAPSDDGQRSKAECDEERGGTSGDTTGIRSRGGSRSFAQ